MNPRKIGNQTKALRVVNRWTCTFVLALLTGGSLWGAAPEIKTLNVISRVQTGRHWCWAACAEMVIEFVKPGTDVRQCDLVKLEWQTSVNCCDESASGFVNACDSEGTFPETCFANHGLSYTPSERRLSWNTIKRQIDDSKPLLYAWYWNETGSSGHMVVIYGYAKARGKEVLYCRDPLRKDLGTETYLLFVDGYKKKIHNETWYDIKKRSSN